MQTISTNRCLTYLSVECNITLSDGLRVTNVETGGRCERIFGSIALVDIVLNFFSTQWDFTSDCILRILYILR
jgi:hypothetical protein